MFRSMARKALLKFAMSKTEGETPLYSREGYITLFDDDTMRILYIPGSNTHCIISFTGIGHALGAIDLQNPEFSRIDSDETKIFIIDKQRSWGNKIDWHQLRSVVSEMTEGAQITTLGNSMGGFLAILAARSLGASHTIAFVPQWSIDPAIVPDETRWMQYRNNINHLFFPDLSDSFHPNTQFSILFGDDPRDQKQRELFLHNNCPAELITIEGGGHDIASFLKKKGILYEAINVCRSRNDLASFFQNHDIKLL